MKKNLLALILFIFIGFNAGYAIVPMNNIHFHCKSDTTKINGLLRKGLDSKLDTPNKLFIFYAYELMKTPYVAHTLEGKKEMLTINVDQLDCTTFIETLYALSQTTLSNRFSWRDFARNLENVRYRGGVMNGYPSRLHYYSDWIVNNTARGNVKEVTENFTNVKYCIRTLDFMTTHRDLYPALKDSAVYAKLRSHEIGFRNHRFPYIRKEALRDKKVIANLRSGDIIAIVTKKQGLDVSHLGIAEIKNGVVYFINASSLEKEVCKYKYDLYEYLRRQTSSMGIRVIRVQNHN